MRIKPLIQFAPFDVAQWEADAEFGVFPQGTRAKDAVFAPDQPPEPVIVPGKRYLFKRSKKSYPDQFWGEVVAYRVGCLLGLPVPPAFAAWNSSSRHCGALIEWFYQDGSELFVMAGDFLEKIQHGFDRKRGDRHNLLDNTKLLRAFTRSKILEPGWRQWWVDALLFDALIGNTDRHQDNWGFIFYKMGETFRCRLAPLFDNGTSLGSERFVDRVRGWTDEDFERYIAKGTHHARWSLADEVPVRGHFSLLERALAKWPDTREPARARLNFTQAEISDLLSDLVRFDMLVPCCPERMAFWLRLLSRRHEFLKTLCQ